MWNIGPDHKDFIRILGVRTLTKPKSIAAGAPRLGKMVIGTVKGDIHDIGKNLVGMMMEGAGFEVVDLGINNSVEKYLAAIEEHGPQAQSTGQRLIKSSLFTHWDLLQGYLLPSKEKETTQVGTV
jgi:hypothetical protein